jgi:hypothetical protein
MVLVFIHFVILLYALKSMAETKPDPVLIEPRPEDILTGMEARIQQLADRGQLPCPRCDKALAAEKVVCEVYEGIWLICLNGCGWREA